MCHATCLEFVAKHLASNEVQDKLVIEVGARDVNGSVRSMIQQHRPRGYLGVDIMKGPGVDEVCDATELVKKYGPDTFDLVVSTEMLEHVEDWREAVHNLKQIARPGGTLLITTRSFGFGYHGYPYDFWRYQKEDIQVIFSDFQILILEDDPSMPGVFIKAMKPANYAEQLLDRYALYSIICGRRVLSVTPFEQRTFLFRYWVRVILLRVENLIARLKRLLSANRVAR